MCSSLSEKIDGPAMDKVSRMRAGQKGFPTATQNDCETHPRREATLTRVDFQGVKRLLKNSHGDPIPNAVSATRIRAARIALPRCYRGKTMFQKPGMGFSNSRGSMAPSRVT